MQALPLKVSIILTVFNGDRYLLQAKRASVPFHVIPNALSPAAALALGVEPLYFSCCSAGHGGCIDCMPGGVVVSSWREMARQIDELCDDSPRWSDLSKAARTAASTVYHLDATTKELLKVLGGGL